MFLVGQRAIAKHDLGHIFSVHLNPLPWIEHMIVDRFLTRSGFLGFTSIDAIYTELYSIISFQVKS